MEKSKKLLNLVIEKDQLGKEYPVINKGGAEGAIYAHPDGVLKPLKEFDVKKIEKVTLLGQNIEDEAFCKILGTFSYGKNDSAAGVVMDRVYPSYIAKDFHSLEYCWFLDEREFVKDVTIRGSDALKRFHELGIAVGDIKDDNIMINEDQKPVFVDTPSVAYKEYPCDVMNDPRLSLLSRTYGEDFSLQDNDIYLYTIMVLNYFTLQINKLEDYLDPKYAQDFVRLMSVNDKAKDILLKIFSKDANKPYVGDAIREINPFEDLFTEENADKLIRLRYW